MNDKGNSIFQDATAGVVADPQIVATARRLQDAYTDTLHTYRRVFLPFAPQDNACLDSAYNHNMVSEECGSAMVQLQFFAFKKGIECANK